MQLPKDIPLSVSLPLGIGGALLNLFSSYLPDDLQTICAYGGVIAIFIAVFAFAFHFIKIQRWQREHAIMWGLIFLFLLALTAFAGFKAYYNFRHPDAQAVAVKNPLDGTIVFECVRAKLPSVVPIEGKINMLDTQYSAGSGLAGVGLSFRMGVPGESLEWEYINECYKCTVKNYASETAFDILAKIKTSWKEVLQEKSGVKKTGAEVAMQDYIVPIPVLKGNGDEVFEFYVVNYSQKEFAYSAPLGTVTIGRIGDKIDQIVKIGYTSGGAMKVGMGLMPADYSKVKNNVTR